MGTRLQPGESPEAFATRCAALGQLGIEHVAVIINDLWTPDTVGVLAEAIPALQQTKT